jgi:hypothetical protein
MRRILEILAVITIMALLSGGGAVVPVAATPGVTVSLSALDEAAPDSDFTANVNISQVVNFDACNYDVSFDASVLRLDSVTSGLIDSTPIPVDVANEVSPGTWTVVQNISGLAGASGSGYLAVLHFHVVGSGGDTSSISLANAMLSNNSAEEIAATWVGDSVAVVASAVISTTPPPAVSPLPEVAAPSAPAPATAPAPASPPAQPIKWSVLWGVIAGATAIGVIAFLRARKKGILTKL